MSTLITLVGCPRPTNYADHKLKVIRNYNCSRSKLARVSLSGGVRCTSKLSHQHSDGRRSGGYQPTLWDYNSIQSLNSEYKEERHLRRAECLIEQVKMLVMEEVDGVSRLELIDDLHWLGISCHFENEITQILNSSYLEFCSNEQMNLYSTSLGFRLLRQHGFHVPQEVFERFMDEMGGSFKANLVDDVKGLLQLYEASFLLKEGEETLERAREFARCILQRKVEESEDQQIDDTLLSSIRASLKVPCHWRIQVPNVRSFIDDYKKRPDMNPIVLELAILDTNILQAQYQEDLKEATRWWKNTCLVQHLPFARDRIVECYSWSIGFVQPRHRRYERIMMARVIALITTMDDVFDVYGTLEELQLFTDTIRRWDDIESIKQLPKYMQLCYIALYNFVNEMTYDTLKERGFNSGTYLRKAWGDLIESYIKEAGWYHSGHKPSLEEYLNNAWISIGAIQVLSHIYFWVTDPVEDEGAQIMHKYHDLVRASSMLLRLADDLGTSLEEVERGDVPKSIQCYMNDNNASEEEARVHVRSLVAETWKRMNEEEESPFCKEFIEAAANLGRMGLFMYQDELDGFGMQNSKVHKLLKGLLFECYT